MTKEEERLYRGTCDWANQICMKILVRLGELFDAEKLIPIDSAHVSGVSYKTLGDAPIEFLKALADRGGTVRTKATLNPQSIDKNYLGEKLKADLVEKQSKILEQFEKMGFTQSLTCTPYYLEAPRPNSHIAWAESSAVVYANSVIGSWTNREGGPSALASAIIGKTPNYGMHKAENREPNVRVIVKSKLRNETEFGALGICLGKMLSSDIPVLVGLEKASHDDLKQMCAGLASTGMSNLFYHEEKSQHTNAARTFNVDTADIKETVENLTTTSKDPDLVFIGCPHCSLDEINKIAQLADGKKTKCGKEFWVCTSRHVREEASEAVMRIEKTGGHVLEGVCTIVSWTEMLGIRTIMTNSAKTAYYAPTLSEADTILAPLQKCLESAFQG